MTIRFGRQVVGAFRRPSGWGRRCSTLAAGFAALALTTAAPFSAQALEIEIIGGGPDRLERQRSWASGDLPLAGTPDLAKLGERLSVAGLKEGAAVFLRVFKDESELELWLQKGREFQLFATYPICQWSGILGPKVYEGDNQSPEGFYTVSRRDLKWQTRHHRAFNIGFPNAFDRQHGRTGSNILVHGGCSTEGCFAMTNPVIDEVFRLANSAIASGQREIPVHIFPFRMTASQMMRQSASPWLDFWLNLKTGHDLFEETRVPPQVGVCRGRYAFDRVPEFGGVEMQTQCDGSLDQVADKLLTTGSIRATSSSPAVNGAGIATPVAIPVPSAASRPVDDRRLQRRAAKQRAREAASEPSPPVEFSPPIPASGGAMGS